MRDSKTEVISCLAGVNDIKLLSLWSRSRVGYSHAVGPVFDPMWNRKQQLFTKSWMDVVGYPHKQLGAEAKYYVMINFPNDFLTDIGELE